MGRIEADTALESRLFGFRPCSGQGQFTLSCSILPIAIEPQDHSPQEPCEWLGHDLQVLLVKLDQILHFKVGCTDFGPVRDRSSLP